MDVDWDNAPEDAEYYLPTKHSNDFWKKDSGGFISHNGEYWNDHVCGLSKVLHLLIPRPNEQPYLPEVDIKCLGNIRNPETKAYSYVEVVPLRDLGSEWVVQVGEGGRPSYCDEFRPLKTQSEKDTEAAYELVKDAVDLYQACEILIEAGYKQ